MENYKVSIQLLGLKDQNMPIFKETRVKRLQSIEKMSKLMAIAPRLMPKLPKTFIMLNPHDPEWDDKMIYPMVNYHKVMAQTAYWLCFSSFYAYNWNVIHANPRLKFVRYFYPLVSTFYLSYMVYDYNLEIEKIRLFENYCQVRAKEHFENNKFMLEHEHFKRFVYFFSDMADTLERVHRQANNHDASDFKDSELVLQDFIRRYSDENNPDAAMSMEDGRYKILN